MSKHAAKRDKGSTFYLLTPNMDYPIEMGEVSFGKFYSYGGIVMLKNILTISEKDSKLLSQIEIKDDRNNTYTAEEFVDMLSNLKVVDNG